MIRNVIWFLLNFKIYIQSRFEVHVGLMEALVIGDVGRMSFASAIVTVHSTAAIASNFIFGRTR